MKSTLQAGVSLVELMVAMVIGLFLVGATASVYLSSKDTYGTSEIVSRMQENGRIALHIIVNDLQMAGFLGRNINPVLIERRKGTTSELDPLSGTPPATVDCADRWYIDMDSLLLVGNNQAPSLNGVSFADRCLANKGLQPATDVIALKRAAVGEIGDTNHPDHATRTLLRTDLMRGEFFLGGDPPPSGMNTGTRTDRRWLAHVYFIAPDSDNTETPLLRRLVLGSGPNLYNREIVPGVQDLQIQYGVDVNGDGGPDKFVEPGTEGSASVVAARVWLLMRSENIEAGHDDSVNTYEYANKVYIPGDADTDNETETAADPRRYRRLLMSATATLRNGPR